MFELQGDLKLKAEGNRPAKTPVQVKAELIYDEKTLEVDASKRHIVRAVRHYESATATIGYSQGSVRPQLREDRQIVAVSAKNDAEIVLFSPLGPLDRDELDLITAPADTVVLDALLPNREVAPGEQWNANSPRLAHLLGLDAVLTSKLVCKLDRVDGPLAFIHAQGTVSGTVQGVASEHEVGAKFRFDSRLRRITWFAMTFKENRAVGHAHPGLEATGRVQVALQKASRVPALHKDLLAQLDLNLGEAARLVEFRSAAGGFELLLDRRWHVLIEREDVSVLRLVDRGDLLAQVNISSLPPLESGETFSIVDFQQDIQRALTDRFGQFVTATESRTDDGLHVMRVVTTGKVDELPIDWIYFHLTDNQGRRASCVYTYESDLAERLGAADQSLVGTFRFTGQPAGSVAEAAARPSAKPAAAHRQ